MKQRVTLHRGSPTGELVADLTHVATACDWSFNEHGPRELRLTAPRRFVHALRLYSAYGLLFVVVSQGLRRVWCGRLSAPELWADDGGSGVTLRALGLWEALDDLRYTVLWSTTQTGTWSEGYRELGGALLSSIPDRFEIKTDNRLYIAPRKGDLHGVTAYNGSDADAWLYLLIPDRSLRSIEYASFTWDVVGAANWRAALYRINDDLTLASGTNPVWSQTGPGTGTQSAAIDTCDGLALRFHLNAANAAFAGETGTTYVRLLDLRVTSDNLATVTAATVAAHIAATVAATNPGILASTTLLTNPGYDFTDLTVEDAAPTELLNRLVERGDGVGTVYVAGVDAYQQLFLRARGTNGRAWAVDVADIQLVSERDTLANRVYATYEDADGRTLRTAAATDATSVGRYGYTREAVAEADTTSATQAGLYRNLTLADGAVVRPGASIAISRIFTSTGGRGELADVRPGDTLTIRNLPLLAAPGTEVDRIRTFRLSETSYDPIRKVLKPTPEKPLPTLDVLIAQGVL